MSSSRPSRRLSPAIVVIETPSLGDRSYLAHDGEVAVVVDPQRDVDRVLAVAEAERVRITHVFETHIHNDYVTGGLALARATGADYVVSEGEAVAFERVPAKDGSTFATGRLVVTALATPGHTQHHLAYALGTVTAGETGETGESAGASEPVAVFTGGSMLFGAVGRTDLLGPGLTDELTRAQYHSVRRLAAELPRHVAVHPTHGFGSFCSATETSGTSSTIGDERRTNVATTTEDEDAFVERLVSGLGAYPRYYAHMGPANLAGPGAPRLELPDEVDAAELRSRVDRGEWVVDLRERRAFARRHVTGTISVELGDLFATFLGWTMTWGTPLTLLGDSAEMVAGAQRELVRIGIDEIAGHATGGPDELGGGRVSGYAVATFDELRAVLGKDGVTVLDVRRPEEWREGHLDGALYVPFYELEARVHELPDTETWVHCAGGFRASISASILHRAGHATVLVDDDFTRAGEIGLPLASG